MVGGYVVTADPPLLETCEAEGITVIALPDSQGAVWSRRTGRFRAPVSGRVVGEHPGAGPCSLEG